jgi:hypothetical protein
MNDRASLKERGQSIILVAVAIVALVLFVAITVDLSFAYQQRRTAQNGADGAALAGVAELATQINNRKKLDRLIQEAMNDFAERNGIWDTEGKLADEDNQNVQGWYVDADGNRLDKEPMVGNGKVPDAAYGIEAITHIIAPTFFGGIFGLSGLPIEARAVSLLREVCGADCIVPITTDVELLLFPNHKPRLDECFNIYRESQVEEPATPGLYGWISWTWQEDMCDKTKPWYDGRPCPGVDQSNNGCDANTLPANLNPDNCASGFVKVGDWMSSATGNMNANDTLCWLRYYLGEVDKNCSECPLCEPQAFTIPVYDAISAEEEFGGSLTPCLPMTDPTRPETGGLHYRVAGFARMQLLGFNISQGNGVNYGDQNFDACVTVGEDPHGGERITAEFLEYITDDFASSSECFDPKGTLRASPKLSE